MKKIAIFIMLIAVFNITFSELVVNVSNTSPSKYDTFRMEVKFINEKQKDYKIEGIENFDVLSKGKNSNYTVVNGNVSSIKSDTYVLKPKNIGKYTLKIKTNNNIERDVQIDVQKNPILEKKLKDRFVLKHIPKNGTYYFGEKIPYQESFITTVNINSLNRVENPDFKDFSVKDITPSVRNSFVQKRITYKGKEALDIILFEGILQPTSSGMKTIKTSAVKVGQDANDFYFNENYTYVGSSNIKLNIKPLPINQPANFKDIVGTLFAKTDWKDTNVSVGQAVTLNIKLYGNGNLELLDKLPIQSDDDFNIFQTVKNYNETIVKNKYFNEKIFEIAFIPKKMGLEKTPKIIIPYFNTKTKKYDKIIINSKSIKVSKGNGVVFNPKNNLLGNNQINSSTPKQNLDINLIKVENRTVKNPYKLLSLILGFIAVLEAVILVCIFYNKKRANYKEKI